MMNHMLKYFLVGCGCFLGGVVRYVSELVIGPHASDPLAILVVNVLGCFIVGVLTGGVIKETVSPLARHFTVTGFCGGLTTFSSFADGIVKLVVSGHVYVGVAYMVANMLLGLFAVFGGLRLVLGPSYDESL